MRQTASRVEALPQDPSGGKSRSRRHRSEMYRTHGGPVEGAVLVQRGRGGPLTVPQGPGTGPVERRCSPLGAHAAQAGVTPESHESGQSQLSLTPRTAPFPPTAPLVRPPAFPELSLPRLTSPGARYRWTPTTSLEHRAPLVLSPKCLQSWRGLRATDGTGGDYPVDSKCPDSLAIARKACAVAD